MVQGAMLNIEGRLSLHERYSLRCLPVAAAADEGADQSGGGGRGGVARVAARHDAEAELLAPRSQPRLRRQRKSRRENHAARFAPATRRARRLYYRRLHPTSNPLSPMRNPTPVTCFIMMPFLRDLKIVSTAVRDVVQEHGNGVAFRADDTFDPGAITEQIKEAIQKSDFCVADGTGANPNVFWEAGHAHALGQP